MRKHTGSVADRKGADAVTDRDDREEAHPSRRVPLSMTRNLDQETA